MSVAREQGVINAWFLKYASNDNPSFSLNRMLGGLRNLNLAQSIARIQHAIQSATVQRTLFFYYLTRQDSGTLDSVLASLDAAFRVSSLNSVSHEIRLHPIKTPSHLQIAQGSQVAGVVYSEPHWICWNTDRRRLYVNAGLVTSMDEVFQSNMLETGSDLSLS